MIIFMTLIFYFSLLFTHLTSPLSLGLTIITLTSLISVTLSITLPTTWFSFLLIMIFLSGMMIIFVYVSSLAANELTVPSPLLIGFISLLYLLSDPILHQTILTLNSTAPDNISQAFYMIYKIYITNMYLFTVFLITYLLLTLIVTLKNSTMTRAPFRMKLHT